jgi:hypothetical protein
MPEAERVKASPLARRTGVDRDRQGHDLINSPQAAILAVGAIEEPLALAL